LGLVWFGFFYAHFFYLPALLLAFRLLPPVWLRSVVDENVPTRCAHIHCNAFEAFPNRRKGFEVSLGLERKHQAIVLVVVVVVVVVGALEGTKSSKKRG
jgi:hypothetical protein